MIDADSWVQQFLTSSGPTQEFESSSDPGDSCYAPVLSACLVLRGNTYDAQEIPENFLLKSSFDKSIWGSGLAEFRH